VNKRVLFLSGPEVYDRNLAGAQDWTKHGRRGRDPRVPDIRTDAERWLADLVTEADRRRRVQYHRNVEAGLGVTGSRLRPGPRVELSWLDGVAYTRALTPEGGAIYYSVDATGRLTLASYPLTEWRPGVYWLAGT
jgi:hypothetical protein